MPNINDAFPSKYIKANDLRGNRHTVTIDRVEFETIGKDRKAVLYFRGKEKGLVLNRTNSNMIIEITGSAVTEEWRGKALVLYPTRVDYQGQRVDATRIDRPPTTTQTRQTAPQTPPPPAAAPEPGSFDSGDDFGGPAPDDDVPF